MNQRVVLTILSALTLAATGAPGPAYRFDEVKSKVWRAPGGDEKQEVRVAAGDAAAAGDGVRTGFWARAVVSVPEKGARFEISSSTRALLAPGEPGVLLSLKKGRLVAIFEALAGTAPEERLVAAPGALLAVRGTRYGVETTSDGESVVAVFEGTVEVRSSLPGVAPVAVHAQEFCTFGARKPPRPAPMGPAGMSEKRWGVGEAGGGPRPGMDGGRPGEQPGGPQPGAPGPRSGGQPMGPKGH